MDSSRCLDSTDSIDGAEDTDEHTMYWCLDEESTSESAWISSHCRRTAYSSSSSESAWASTRSWPKAFLKLDITPVMKARMVMGSGAASLVLPAHWSYQSVRPRRTPT